MVVVGEVGVYMVVGSVVIVGFILLGLIIVGLIVIIFGVGGVVVRGLSLVVVLLGELKVFIGVFEGGIWGEVFGGEEGGGVN